MRHPLLRATRFPHPPGLVLGHPAFLARRSSRFLEAQLSSEKSCARAGEWETERREEAWHRELREAGGAGERFASCGRLLDEEQESERRIQHLVQGAIGPVPTCWSGVGCRR